MSSFPEILSPLVETLSADVGILCIGKILSLIWQTLSPIVKTLSADVGILISYWRDTVSYFGDTVSSTILGDTSRRIPPKVGAI